MNVKSQKYNDAVLNKGEKLSSGSVLPKITSIVLDNTNARFQFAFSGDEFYFAHHIVHGKKVMPGVLYLELIQTALDLLSSQPEFPWETPAGHIVELIDILWIRPCCILGNGEEPTIVELDLKFDSSGEFDFSVYSCDAESRTLHCRGGVSFSPKSLRKISLIVDPSQGLTKSYDSQSEIYDRFEEIGIQYGQTHIGIDSIWTGPGSLTAALSLPSNLTQTLNSFSLHPCLADCGVQAAILLFQQYFQNDNGHFNDYTLELVLPFALDNLNVLAPCEASMWVKVSMDTDNNLPQKKDEANSLSQVDLSQKFNIEMINSSGETCISFTGLQLHARLSEVKQLKELNNEECLVTQTLLTPVWQPVIVEPCEPRSERVVVIGAAEVVQNRKRVSGLLNLESFITVNLDDEDLAGQIKQLGEISRFIWLVEPVQFTLSNIDEMVDLSSSSVGSAFRLIKMLISLGYGEKDLEWMTITLGASALVDEEGVNPDQTALAGLFGSLSKEYPHWNITLVDVINSTDYQYVVSNQVVSDDKKNFVNATFRDGQFYEKRLAAFSGPDLNESPAQQFRHEGVYIIVGGAGGVGGYLTEYLVENYNASVIWVGRRELDDEISRKLRAYNAERLYVQYRQADASDYDALNAVSIDVRNQFGQINGVVHSGIVLADKSLANMSEEEFYRSYAPKAMVSVCLAKVFAEEPLDFVLFFSSIMSFTTSPGQSNYAAGCVFNDSFAIWLANLCRNTHGSFRTKVVNWGYWGDAGSVATPEYRRLMDQCGLSSISPPEGMAVIKALMASATDQLIFLKTNKEGVLSNIDQSVCLKEASDATAANLEKVDWNSVCARPHFDTGTDLDEFNNLLHQFLFCYLNQAGVIKANTFSLAESLASVPHQYHRWMEESLASLVYNGLLLSENKQYMPTETAKSLTTDSVFGEWNQCKNRFAVALDYNTQVELLDVILPEMESIITGQRPVTDLMFPDASMARVEGIFKHNRVADYFNTSLADILVEVIKSRIENAPEKKIRILEIGAGTGGTTEIVLQKLSPYRDAIEMYCYTDLSNAFLLHGQDSFGGLLPSIEFKILNIEEHPSVQDHETGFYDFVIATNVLHATKRIDETLVNTKSLLKKNGLLLLNEIDQNSIFFHLTYGFLDGWWRYEDAGVRIDGSPALSPENWRYQLLKSDFDQVRIPLQNKQNLGQQIIVARSNGLSMWPKESSNAEMNGTMNTLFKVEELTSEDRPMTTRNEDQSHPSNRESEKGSVQQSTIAIASTFTVDPIMPFIADSFARRGQHINVLNAPYRQVLQQLLDTNSVINQKDSIANLLMIRVEDFAFEGGPANLNTVDVESRLNGLSTTTLPNQIKIAQLNDYESQYLYDEIFVEKTYARNGIEFRAGDTVLDIGANIGMFALFVHEQCPTANVYSFEPAPQAFEILEANTDIMGESYKAFNFGIAGENRSADFTYYPNSSVFSSFYADTELDEAALRTLIINQIKQHGVLTDPQEIEEYAQVLLKGRLESVNYKAELRSLSSVIAEQNIQQIDLLKLDAEKCEWEVLSSLSDDDWEKIKQIVVEVHDITGKLQATITQLLEDKGFSVEYYEEEALQGSGLDNLYARKHDFVEKTNTTGAGKGTEEQIEHGVEELLNCLATYAKVNTSTTLLGICPPSLAFNESCGKAFFEIINARIADRLSQDVYPSVYLLDFNANLNQSVGQYYDDLRDEMGNIPYQPDYFSLMAQAVTSSIFGYAEPIKKVIALDCDNTLWNGVCGEVGAKGIVLSEPYLALQQYMLSLQEQGMLLCLVSKNHHDDVKNVFDDNSSMCLSWNNITSTRINWDRKSDNLISLANELNLGLDAFIFIDDNPVECAEVKERCPEVLTLQLPQNTDLISSYMKASCKLMNQTLTEEDRSRGRMYQENAKREALKDEVDSLASFIDGLGLKVEFSSAELSDYPRIAQLSARTNQFNINKKARTEGEIAELIQRDEYLGWTVRVSDRFGDYGLTGVIIAKKHPYAVLVVDTFLLSCRVLGRSVEFEVLNALGQYAKDNGFTSIQFPLTRTEKNEPAMRFLNSIAQRADDVMALGSQKAFDFSSQQLIDLVFSVSDPKQEQAPNIEALSPKVEVGQSHNTLDENALHSACVAYLVELFAEMMQRPLHDIGENDGYDAMNVTSFLMIEIIVRLEQDFGRLPKTILFEYLTISQLAKYFLENHREKLSSLLTIVTSRCDPIELQDGISDINEPIFSGYEEKPRETKTQASDSDRQKTVYNRDIAIVGMSGRFPEAGNVEKFWENLCEGVNSITAVPEQRWSMDDFYHPVREEASSCGKSYSKWGGFIENVDCFDPLFFNLSPVEATQMDPQERLFLQEVYHCIEDAGYTPQSLSYGQSGKRAEGKRNRVSLFVGVMNSAYATGANYWAIANRASYLLDFNGPSVAIDTACSSSLTALHFAAESIYSGSADCAIAGGVNLILSPSQYVRLSALNMLSPGDRCKSFGIDGDGFVDGEGVAALLLKPLAKAKADGDHIYGVIKGTSVNSGGKTNGFTVPNPHAQASLVADCIERSGIDARSISYVEAHGTGTSLGDPIEIASLSAAYMAASKDKQYCAIGSVKSNIGHLESAAGIAGVVKVLLQMKHKMLVPSLHSKTLNPNIDFENSPFVVQQDLSTWNRPVLTKEGQQHVCPRVAAVSSFGAGGSNAHVIIEEYDDSSHAPFEVATTAFPILLSARSEDALKEQVGQLLDAVNNYSEQDLPAVAYTLQIGREAMDYRLAFVVDSRSELQDRLSQFIVGDVKSQDIFTGTVKRQQKNWNGLAKDEDLVLMVDSWLKKKKFTSLLSLWVDGLEVDWNKLYGEVTPTRISLPTYPFARERYWIDSAYQISAVTANDKVDTDGSYLHPLIHSNTSTLSVQRFDSMFSGREIFLSDHIVMGEAVLPGTAYLEMIRAVATLSIEKQDRISQALVVNDVTWLKPAIVRSNHGLHLQTSLYPSDSSDLIDIEVTNVISTNNIEDQKDELLLQASVEFVPRKPLASIDLGKLKASGSRLTISPIDLYREFDSVGLSYGRAFQCITEFYALESSGALLARIAMPQDIHLSQGGYDLHPCLLDSGFHAALISLFSTAGRGGDTDVSELALMVPFQMKRLLVLNACLESAWVFISPHQSNNTNKSTQTFDITFCGEQGDILVKVEALTLKKISRELSRESRSNNIISVTSDHSVTDSSAVEPEHTALESTDTTKQKSITITQEDIVMQLNQGVLRDSQFSKPSHSADKPAMTEIQSGKPGSLHTIKQVIRDCLTEVAQLKQNHIDNDVSFKDYGIDSIIAVRLIKSINDRFGLLLQTTLLFDFVTVDQLANELSDKYGDQLTSMGDGEDALSQSDRAHVAGSGGKHG